MEPSALQPMVDAITSAKTEILAVSAAVITAGGGLFVLKYGAGWVKGLFRRVAG